MKVEDKIAYKIGKKGVCTKSVKNFTLLFNYKPPFMVSLLTLNKLS